MSQEPVLLKFVNDRVTQVDNPGELDMEELLAEAVSLATELVPEHVKAARERSAARVAWRKQTAYGARRAIAETWENTIGSYNYLLAAGEEIHARALDNAIVRWKEAREVEVVRSSEGDCDGKPWVVGVDLKILVLLSMHARACITATEVGHLASSGFMDGALARLRTLYEITMIHCFLAASSYEICERYHAYGVMEHLADLRAEQQSNTLFKWGDPSPEERMAEIEDDVRTIYRRYGPEIRRPFEWARPRFGDAKKRITFADLDRSISNNALRMLYRITNHRIHAGSLATTRGVDVSKRYLNSTRPSGDVEDFPFLISSAVKLTTLAMAATCRQLAIETDAVDEIFSLSLIEEAGDATLAALNKDMERQG